MDLVGLAEYLYADTILRSMTQLLDSFVDDIVNMVSLADASM